MTALQVFRRIGAITISEEAISGTVQGPITVTASAEVMKGMVSVAAASAGGTPTDQIRLSISAGSTD